MKSGLLRSKAARLAVVAANAVRNGDLFQALELLDLLSGVATTRDARVAPPKG